MFLQSQKKKSNIKYKTSEKPKKKKPKSKPKSKPKLKPKPVEQIPPPEIEENPVPSNIRPIINQPPIPQPEMPVEVFANPVPQPFDNSPDVESHMRFNNRTNAKFGIEEEESEGPDLFVNVEDGGTEETRTYQGKTSDFVSMGKNDKNNMKQKKNGTPFDSDGIFGDFDLSKKQNKKHNSHFRNAPGSKGENRKVISEMNPPKYNKKGKKKKLVNIFENPNEDEYSNFKSPTEDPYLKGILCFKF